MQSDAGARSYAPELARGALIAGVTDSELSLRVKGAAEAMLAEEGYVAPVDVLVRMGWLPPVRVDEWRQGRLPALERGVQANLHKFTSAMRILRRWARDQGLQPSQTDYVARTRDQRNLQFSVGGDPAIEKAYRTHWVSPDWSEAKRRRLAERQSKPPDLVVIDALGDWTCTECSGTGQLMLLEARDRCAWPAPIWTIWSSCLGETRRSPDGPRRPAPSPRW